MSQLLVYETTPLNAAVLARLADVNLREVRSLSQLENAILDQPKPQAIAIEVTMDTLLKVVTLIHRAKSRTGAAVIAMPDSTVRLGIGALYEAGTDLVFRSMLDRPKARTLIRNKIRIHEQSDEKLRQLGFKRRVWSSLPWKRQATS